MTVGRPPRAVVDTNLFVSGLIAGGLPGQVLQAFRDGRFLLLIAPDLRAEIEGVLRRPEIAQRYGLSPDLIAEVLALLDSDAVHVTPLSPSPVTVRDPKDQMLLDTALGGAADFLATGDSDLRALVGHSQLGALQIVSARQFLEVLGVSPS
jgi:putative PIN family toxin of toxin-antitoxin system